MKILSKKFFNVAITSFLLSLLLLSNVSYAMDNVTTVRLSKVDIIVQNMERYYPLEDVVKVLNVGENEITENGKIKLVLSEGKNSFFAIINDKDKLAYTSLGKFPYILHNKKYSFTEEFYKTVLKIDSLSWISSTNTLNIIKQPTSTKKAVHLNTDDLKNKITTVTSTVSAAPIVQPKIEPSIISRASVQKSIYETGQATWYGEALHGNLTASGVPFDMNAMTAAHKLLPFGTEVKVTNLTNGKSVQVVINDRGPFAPGSIIDLSQAAAKEIYFFYIVVAPVQIEIIKKA